MDKAGRLVIPAAARKTLGLKGPTELELRVDDQGIHLERSVSGPSLERSGGRLVVRATVPREARPQVDVAAWIDEERER